MTQRQQWNKEIHTNRVCTRQGSHCLRGV